MAASPATRSAPPGPSSLAPAGFEHPILRGERGAEKGRRLAGPAAERGGDALQRGLIGLHRLEPRHDDVEQPVARALRFPRGLRPGESFGVELGLKGAKDVRLAGELAPEVGETEIGCAGDVGEADIAPAPLFGEIERRLHRLGTFGEIVEHGRYSFTPKHRRF